MSSFSSSSENQESESRSNSNPKWTYDVFISFIGEDTCRSFASDLYASLHNAGIYVFRDCKLRKGDQIFPTLLQAIEGSRISIIVFSRNYAASSWCLEELEKIIECRRTIGQVVLPVFYDVDPFEVSHQTGMFAKAFEKLEKILSSDKVLSWRAALREASGLPGYDIRNFRNEMEGIKNVVQRVTHLLALTDLVLPKHPVGIEPRVQDVIECLNYQNQKDVQILGILGIGGVGKTTIAKVIYYEIGHNFEGRSFLSNIREVWEQDIRHVSLQEQLLYDIYKITKITIHSIEYGKKILKERLCHKRVLIVLDDVNKLEQLNALSVSREWFGAGSKIIITTRDMHLLHVLGVDHVYRMKEMDETESVKLLSWHAFNQSSPREDFLGLSRSVVAYCGGLPLALEVIGSCLFGKGTAEWESVLDRLKRIPHPGVQKVLKGSYDGLNDDLEKDIFLDIACFFIGMDKNDVIHILNGCGLFAEIGMSVLLERGLVTIDNKNKLRMHDLLRDMGREIVREKSPKEPEKRSRLWVQEDVIDVLSRHTGTKAIKGLALKSPRANTICFETKAFMGMKRLRLLQLVDVQLVGDLKYIPRGLRWLCWHGFPLKYVPDFCQESLAAIELKYSKVKLVWKKAQLLENLKILNLSHCHYLTQTPDFSYLPNLEKLVLKDCPSLSAVSHTIGYLNKILLINLKGCTGLRKLPGSIYKLKSMKTLILSGCLMIDNFEEDLEQMESLTTLIANKTAIKRVPFSVVRSKTIGYISLCGYEGFSRDVFPSLIWSWMSPTNNLSSLVQTSAAMLSLFSVDIPNSSSHGLSSIFKNLPKLQSLTVRCCSELQLTQDVARILDTLYDTDSKELEAMPIKSQVSNIKTSTLVDFRSQFDISGSILIQMGRNSQVTNILKESILQKLAANGFDDCLLPGDNPDWLAFNGEGSSVTFEVPPVNGRNIKTMMMCVVYFSSPDIMTSGFKNLLIINYTKTTTQVYVRDALTSFKDEEWQSLISSLEPGNKVRVVVVIGNGFIVKKTTVYLIYDEPIDKKMEHCHAPDKDIKNVVEHVTSLLDWTDLIVAKYPVGVESRVQYVIQLLSYQKPEDVLLLGIWGMGGIGKTAIAKAIYKKIGCNFEGSSFLSNIREVWEQVTRHVSLQERLLSNIYKTKKITIHSIESGKKIIKERLCNKKVLLVLDDVHKLEQLNAFCGSRDWFCPGSIIIITTRDKRLLDELGVDCEYKVKEMDDSESIELFSWHAFKQVSPRVDFSGLSRNIVAYSGGLPLALVVLGSELCGKEIAHWETVLDRLKRIPNPVVQKVLKISFDGLHHDRERDIFLDIASFFTGMDQNEVIKALNAFGDFTEIGISVLANLSLLTIDEQNRLGMHALLQKMGREIIRERSEMGRGAKDFDVFLSFRGRDTRASFTAHLYTSLRNAGIFVFRDDDEIPRGDRVSISLLNAIGRSIISVIVLSINYANSRWCMLELERIMECRRAMGQVVVPVFYGVDPSEVRHQTGMFGEAFNDLIRRISVENDQVQSWRTALNEIGGIAGVVVINSRNESEDVKNVVRHVTCLLDRRDFVVANHPVGVESRVEKAIKLLNKQQAKDVILLGIWGMGGIGKTTIAKAIYNQIGSNFGGRSFILNIREVWEQVNGQVSLQEQLLSDIYETMPIKIRNIESGKITLQERLCCKRVLLVFDDVNKLEQLNALCGSREWFGTGSRVIITTRDMHLLSKLEVDDTYRVKEMDESEAVELFSWHAFKQANPREDFAGLSRNVVDYSGGLPLALEVLGCYLFDRGVTEWKSALEKLKIIPHDQVQNKLRVSYDGLSDDKVKGIFLDVAFFFIGMDLNDVIQILNGCGHFADIGIRILLERSLVTVDNKNKLGMHDLLRDMGREIIRQKLPDDPEERSRLWYPEDVRSVLSNHTGTKAVEGLTLKLPRIKPITLRTEAFEKMRKLRLLQFDGVKLVGDFKYLSRDLRWLCWHGFPLTYTPTNFHQGSLVAIELKYSNLKLVWKGTQKLGNLKSLNLSHSHYLQHTPDFSNLPNLEKLIIKDCPSLSSISHTIGHLKELLLINLKDCKSLRSLPRSIYKLKSLETLILSGCIMIEKLEEDLEQMVSLTTLIADRTAVTRVPFSVVRLKSIGRISLCGYEGLSRDVFPSLIWSWMSPTNNVLSLVQTFADMSSLVALDLPSCSSHVLSSIFNDLPRLRSLCVKCSSELQLTRDVARILDTLNATNCMESEATPTASQVSNIRASALIDCRSQLHMSGSKNSLNYVLIQMGMNSQVTNILKESIFKNGPGHCLLPGNNHPDWLTFHGEGSSIIFEVPRVNGRNLKTVMIIFYTSSPAITRVGLKNVFIISYTKTTAHVYKRDTLTSFEDEDWQSIMSNLEPGNKVEVRVAFERGFIVKKTAVYLIYETIDEKMEHCHAPVMPDPEPAFSYEDEEEEFMEPLKKKSRTNIGQGTSEISKSQRQIDTIGQKRTRTLGQEPSGTTLSHKIVKASSGKDPNLSENKEEVAESLNVNPEEEEPISSPQKKSRHFL